VSKSAKPQEKMLRNSKNSKILTIKETRIPEAGEGLVQEAKPEKETNFF
jgi:hypothetical protein